MIKYITIIGLIFLASIIPASSASSFAVVRDDPGTWTCVDHTVNYCNNNPEFIPCSISSNPLFKGISHMVAVKVIDTETLLVYDGLYNAEYIVHGWYNDGQYYHFWKDEPIKRNYKHLIDNREVVYH